MIPIPVLLVLVAIEGWSENAADWNYGLLRKALESVPGVVVVVPHYLDAKGIFSKFKSHLPVELYSMEVEKAILQAKKDYPNAAIMVMGHSLGGIIARFLCFLGLFPSKDMILVGTPNQGINFGRFANGILKFLARPRLCNVPVFYQLLEGSKFLAELNKNGFPADAYYISGTKDKVVPLWSSDPLNIGRFAECGHKLFPQKEELMETSAIPIVKEIIEERLAEIRGASH